MENINTKEIADISKKLDSIISILEKQSKDIDYLKQQEAKTMNTENVLARWGTWYALSFAADKILGIDNGSFGPTE